MLFLVQDFLDYAQIKTGKFRKNITKFNIRDTVEKVIKMQSKKALDTKIKLFASYNNSSNSHLYNRDWAQVGATAVIDLLKLPSMYHELKAAGLEKQALQLLEHP